MPSNNVVGSVDGDTCSIATSVDVTPSNNMVGSVDGDTSSITTSVDVELSLPTLSTKMVSDPSCDEISYGLIVDVDSFHIDLLLNKFVVVKYDNRSYPGKVVDIDEKHCEIKVSCMHSVGRNRYFFTESSFRRLLVCIWGYFSCNCRSNESE